MVARDIGGKVFYSVKGLSSSIGEMGQVDGSIIGKVSVMDKGEEMEVDDIAIVIEEVEEVGTKSWELEQGIAIKLLRVVMIVVGREELRVKDSGMSSFIIV